MNNIQANKYDNSGSLSLLGDYVFIVLLMVATWLSINSVWGFTGPDTFISSKLSNIAPLGQWIAIFNIAFIVGLTIIVASKQYRLMQPTLILFAYSIGVFVSEVLREYLAPQGAVVDRLFAAMPILLMLTVTFVYPELRLQITKNIAGYENWVKTYPIVLIIIVGGLLLLGFTTFSIKLFFDLVGASSSWWPTIGDISALSFLNGFWEEIIFRGLILFSLLSSVRADSANILQSFLFAILHLGASPSFIGALSSGGFLFILGFCFGRIAMKPGGLLIVIGLHMAIDIVSLSLVL